MPHATTTSYTTRRTGANMPDRRGLDESAAYVAAQEPAYGDVWQVQAASHGFVGTHRIVFAGQVAVSSEVSPWIREPTAVNRKRLIMSNGEPVEVAESWFPLSIAEDTPLSEPKKVKGGTASVLAERGVVVRRVDEYVTAPAVGNAVLCELLGLSPSDRVLRLIRVSRTAEGGLVEVAVMTMKPDLPDGELRQLQYELATG